MESAWHDISDYRNAYFNPRHGGGRRPVLVYSCSTKPVINPSGAAPAALADGSVRLYAADDIETWTDSATPAILPYGGAKHSEIDTWVLYCRSQYYP